MTEREAPPAIFMASHYSIGKLESIDSIRTIFPDGKADDLNWLLLSTSGVHGSYCSIDHVEEEWDDDGGNYITALVVRPRLVCLQYGEIEIEKKDIPYLRGLVASTLEQIPKTQEGNV